MADTCSTTTTSASEAETRSSATGSNEMKMIDRKQKQELRRKIRGKRAITQKPGDVTKCAPNNIVVAKSNNIVVAKSNDIVVAKSGDFVVEKSDNTRESVNVHSKESLKFKCRTDVNKALIMKDQELNKLRQDLAKCQLELREELEKRGQSSSARSGFDLERSRLLGELRESGEAKRRLELALEAASSNIKRKTAEMREMQEAEKIKIASLEKSANNEIRKLLDELRAKDQLIASADKPNSAKNSPRKNHPPPQITTDPLETNFDTGQIYPNLSCKISAQRRMYIMEKQLQQWAAANEFLTQRNKEHEEERLNLEKNDQKLRSENKKLNFDLESIKTEVNKLTEMLSEKNILLIKDQIDSLKDKNKEQKLIIDSMQDSGQSCLKKKSVAKEKHRKTLSFFLPGDTAPTPGGKVPMFVDDWTMTDEEINRKESIESNKLHSDEVNTKDKADEKIIDKSTEDSENKNNSLNCDPVSNDPIQDDLDNNYALNIADDYYDENMEEEHFQMEASFELMMQQEIMNQEKVQQELMQQEHLQQMQILWDEEKENMCNELIYLKEKLKIKTDSDDLSKKIASELQEKFENLEFKYYELEGEKNTVELVNSEVQTVLPLTIDASTHSEEETRPSIQVLPTLTTEDASTQADDQSHPHTQSATTVYFNTLPANEELINLSYQDVKDNVNNAPSSVSSCTSGFVEATTQRVSGGSSGSGNHAEVARWMDLCEELEGKLRESRRRLRQIGDRAALMVAEKERRIKHLELLLRDDGESENESEKGIPIESSQSVFDWSADNYCVSPRVEVESMGFQRFWSLSDDEEEQQERRIAALEKDCQALREIVEMDESIISELQQQLSVARCSELSLVGFVERLEAAEVGVGETMASMEKENSSLHREIDRLEKLEKMQRWTIAELRGREASVNDRMSDMISEFYVVEERLKRRLSESKREMENMTKVNVRLEDREGELTALVDLFRKKIANMQRLNQELQQQLLEQPAVSKLSQAYQQSIEEERTKNELLVESAKKWQAELASTRAELVAAHDEIAAVTIGNCRLAMKLEESVFVEAKLAAELQEYKVLAANNTCHRCSRKSVHSDQASSQNLESVEESNSLSEISEIPEDEDSADGVTNETFGDVTRRENGSRDFLLMGSESMESLNDSGFASEKMDRKKTSERINRPSKIPKKKKVPTATLR